MAASVLYQFDHQIDGESRLARNRARTGLISRWRWLAW